MRNKKKLRFSSIHSESAGLRASNILSSLHAKTLLCLDRFFLANGAQNKKPFFSGFFFKYLLDSTFFSDRFFYLSSFFSSNKYNSRLYSSFFFRKFNKHNFLIFFCRNFFLSDSYSIFSLKKKKKTIFTKSTFNNKKKKIFRKNKKDILNKNKKIRFFNLYENSIINFNKLVFKGRYSFIRHMRNKCFNSNLTFADSLFNNSYKSFFFFFL